MCGAHMGNQAADELLKQDSHCAFGEREDSTRRYEMVMGGCVVWVGTVCPSKLPKELFVVRDFLKMKCHEVTQ